MHQIATISSWLNVLELMLSSLALGAFTLFCMTRPCVLKHVKKCNKHNPKIHIIANINPKAVYVAFCSEFMSLQAVSLSRVRTYIFRQHPAPCLVLRICYILHPGTPHFHACQTRLRSLPQDNYCRNSTEYDRHQATHGYRKCNKSLSYRHCLCYQMSA